MPDAKNSMIDKVQRFTAAREGRGRDDMTPMVEFYRGDKPVSVVIAARVDRDLALDAIAIGVPGFDADRVVFCLDTHQSIGEAGMIDPRTGEPWAPGAMQEACDEQGYCDTGLIVDAITVHEAFRDGHFRMRSLPYRVDKATGGLTWLDEYGFDLDGEGEVIDGLIPAAVRAAFERPTLADAARSLREDFGLTEEEAIDHNDCAVAKVLMTNIACIASLYAPPGSQREGIIRKSFEDDDDFDGLLGGGVL